MKAEDITPDQKTETSAVQPPVQQVPNAPMPNDQDNEHALIQLPFVVAIEGRRYEGKGISLVNAFVTGLAAPEIDATTKIAVFRFPFDGFSVTQPIDVRVEPVDKTTGLYKLAFVNPTASHLPQLRYLLNSFISGDIVSMDELLRVPPEKSTKKNKNENTGSVSAGRVLKRLTGTALVAAASIGMIATASYALQNRLFVHEVPALANIVPSGLSLKSPEAGQVAYVNSEAQKGEVVFSIQTVRGDVLSIENPCDCPVVLAKQGIVGATVFPVTPIAFVTFNESAPVLKARVPDALAKMLLEGAKAEAELPDGRQVVASLSEVETDSSPGDPESLVTLTPDSEPFADEDVGRAVSLKIVNKGYFDFVNRFQGLWLSARAYYENS
jgi:hypothetical protein